MDDITEENSSPQTAPSNSGGPAAKEYACTSCGDTKKVLVTFTGANGGFTKQVPCPDCDGGLTVGRVPVDKDKEQRENAILLGLIGAGALVALLILTRNGRPKAPEAAEHLTGVLADD